MMKYETGTADRGLTIKEVLKRRMGFSTRLLRRLKLEGGVMLNGQPKWLNVTVQTGDLIQVELPREESWFAPEDIPVETLYEDEALLLINKQPGIVVHPTKGHPDGTIANAIAWYMREKGQRYKIRFVNRLDMDTSGVLVIAKDPFVQEALVRQMKQGKTEKRYLAILDGFLEPVQGVVNVPIGTGDEASVGRIVSETGAPSVTKYRVLEYFTDQREEEENGGQMPRKAGACHSLVELILETGRTHQIRVHMSYMGHPVTGDSLYGMQQPEQIGRQALHAASFSFLHPKTGERICVQAPLPPDMRKLLERAVPVEKPFFRQLVSR